MKKGLEGIQGHGMSGVYGVVVLAALWAATVADASLTEIHTSNEPTLAEQGGILDELYGLENLTRVQDGGAKNSTDQYWTVTGDSATVTGRAKYAGFPLQFGILEGLRGWDYDIAMTTGANKYGIYGETKGMPIQSVTRSTGGGELSDIFRFGLRLPNQRGYIWSSVPTDNAVMPGGFIGDGTDHMVTWQITGNAGYEGNQIGNYIVAWEDLAANGSLGGSYDADYNDLVVEISGVQPIPEPAGFSLFALMGIFVHRFQRKHR